MPRSRGGKTAALQTMVITEIFKSIQGRRHTRGPAVHIRASDGLQSALHLVRYRVCIPWREEDERRGSFVTRG